MGEIFSVPAGAILENWSFNRWSGGIEIEHLDDQQSLFIETENSTYEITVVNGRRGEILVRGGQFFPAVTPARLSGSTMGGCLLKTSGINVGFGMEFHVINFPIDQRRVVTSPVRSIALVDNSASTNPRLF